MPIFEQFPYTNLHELNLDWLIHETKKMIKQWETFADNVEATAVEGTTANVVVDSSVDGLKFHFTLPKGEKGDKGEQGEKGEQGDKGEPFTILGHYDTLDDLEIAHPQGNTGDIYIVGTDNNFIMYLWDTDEWVNIGSITAPTASDITPLMDGEASIGESTKYAREDHVHPTDTNKVNIDNNNNYINALDFGLSSDNEDNNSILTELISKAKSDGKKLYIPSGTYANSNYIFSDDSVIENHGNIDKLIISKEIKAFRRFKWASVAISTLLNDDDINYSFQSVAYIGNLKYALLFRYDGDTSKNKIVIIDTGLNVSLIGTVDTGHCNGCCYNPNTETLYIATGDEGTYANKIIGVDLDTMLVTYVNDIQQNVAGIAYDHDHDIYYILTGSISAYDNAFNFLKTVGYYNAMSNYIDPNSVYQSQTLSYYDHNILYSSNQLITGNHYYKRANINTFNFDNATLKQFFTFPSFNYADEMEMIINGHFTVGPVGFGAENSQLTNERNINIYVFSQLDSERVYDNNYLIHSTGIVKESTTADVEIVSQQLIKKSGIVQLTITIRPNEVVPAYATIFTVPYTFRPIANRTFVYNGSKTFALKDDGNAQCLTQLEQGTAYQMTFLYIAVDTD